jgi:UDP-N-acetylglucosamine 1-carboxyvinyltransferase
MAKLIVNWWKPLRWTINPVPNKNSILKLIPASLLADDIVTLHNVPQTSDVEYMIKIFENLGGVALWLNDATLQLDARAISSYTLDHTLMEKMKAGTMFAGPLLQRFGKVIMPNPQWCKLWSRPMDVFIENMVSMGATYTYTDGAYVIEATTLTWTEIWQWFPSVTWTENLILLAVKAPGTTVIYNAACEPHTQDLCAMLVSMGAQIEGVGSNKLIITWVPSLKGTTWTVISDHLDVAGMIGAAVMTHGEITITNAIIPHMRGILQVYEKLWVRVILDENHDTITVPADQELQIHKTIKGNPLRVHALQWPQLPPDFVHSMAVVALKADGQVIFDNLFYEYGWFFVEELAKMKANVVMANPVTVITNWPTQFKPANLLCSDIIQASYGLLLAALSAPWTSTLHAITPLFRRFPNFVDQFRSLGGDLTLEE